MLECRSSIAAAYLQGLIGSLHCDCEDDCGCHHKIGKWVDLAKLEHERTTSV